MGLALLLMFCCHLGLASTKIVPEEQPTIFMDEEYIDILQMPSAPDMKGDEPSRAQADEQLSAQPTPISGTDVEDAGAGVDAPKIVAQKEESPMKVKEKEPEQPAPAVDQKKKRRRGNPAPSQQRDCQRLQQIARQAQQCLGSLG